MQKENTINKHDTYYPHATKCQTKSKTIIFLFIIKKKNIDETYIKNICLKKLSKFQFPNKIYFLKKFPKTNVGKINKIKLLLVNFSLIHGIFHKDKLV